MTWADSSFNGATKISRWSRSVPNGTHTCSGITSARLFVYGEGILGRCFRPAILGGCTGSIDSDGGDFNKVLFEVSLLSYSHTSFLDCPHVLEFSLSPSPPSPIHH